jgi:hypothetical protein
MSRSKRIWIPLVVAALLVTSLGLEFRGLVAQTGPSEGPARHASSTEGNLLVNSSFESLPFYHQPPNHYIGGGWNRWWIHGGNFPEFSDSDGSHNYDKDGTHSQVQYIWGKTYTAGIFQVVDGVTPCRPYRLTMWTRNHSLAGAQPHARIGLDPQGALLTPDGAVKDTAPLDRASWSREQTALSTWEELSVETEPTGSSLTAILYASPQPGSGEVHFYDTFWDAGSLIERDFAGDTLPDPTSWGPSAYLTNVEMEVVTSTEASSYLTISWETPIPSSMEVRYEVTRAPYTPTVYSHTTYLPIMSTQVSPINYTPSTRHSKTISGLHSGDEVRLWILSRMPINDICTTEGYGPIDVTIP